MTRGVLFFAVVLTVAGIGCGSDGGSETEEVSGSYYEFALPSGWVETSDASRAAVSEVTPPGTQFDLSVAATEATGGFNPNLAVVTTRKVGNVRDSIQLAEVNLDTASRGNSLPLVAGGGSVDARSEEVEESEIAGEPAGVYEQVAEAPEGRVLQRQYFVLRDGLAYAITYSALDDKQYDEYLPDAEEIFDSWAWEEAPEVP